MAQDQINDQGAVIGYQPILRYDKELNNVSEIAENDKKSSNLSQNSVLNSRNSAKNGYSKALNSFLEAHPSKTLANLEKSKQFLRDLIDDLTGAFKTGNWENYANISMLITALESGSDDIAQQFVDYHANNINGSIIPEIIYDLNDQINRIDIIISGIRDLFYGNPDDKLNSDVLVNQFPKVEDTNKVWNVEEVVGDIVIDKDVIQSDINLAVINDFTDLSEIEYFDKQYIEQIKALEENNKHYKINYPVLASDSLLCKTYDTYSIGVKKRCNAMANIALLPDINAFKTNLNKYSITNLYNTVRKQLDTRCGRYDVLNKSDILLKALYNYYAVRIDMQQINMIYSQKRNRVTATGVLKTQNKLKNAISNIARSVKANENYLINATNIRESKNFLMDMYANYNYNKK